MTERRQHRGQDRVKGLLRRFLPAAWCGLDGHGTDGPPAPAGTGIDSGEEHRMGRIKRAAEHMREEHRRNVEANEHYEQQLERARKLRRAWSEQGIGKAKKKGR